jgi:predicted nucleic acid-binding protein
LAVTLYLLDKSATAARHGPGAQGRLQELLARGQLAMCQLTALELLYSARSEADYENGRMILGAYIWLDTTTACLQRALDVQRELARSGRHRVPIPDLVIAATAEHHGATVLHFDKDYELIAEVTGQPVERIAGPGGASTT